MLVLTALHRCILGTGDDKALAISCARDAVVLFFCGDKNFGGYGAFSGWILGSFIMTLLLYACIICSPCISSRSSLLFIYLGSSEGYILLCVFNLQILDNILNMLISFGLI